MSSEEIILFVGALIMGIIKVPLFDWLKTVLKLDGTAALIAAYVVSFAIAFVALLLGGELVGGNTLENFFAIAATVIATAQFTYKILNPAPQS